MGADRALLPLWPARGPPQLLAPVPIKIGDGLRPRAPSRQSGALQGLSSDALLALAAGLLICVAVLKELQSRTTSLTKTYASEKLVLGFRARIFRHAQRLSVSTTTRRGRPTRRTGSSGTRTLISAIASTGSSRWSSPRSPVSMLVVIVALDWQLGLVAIAVTPALFLSSRMLRAAAPAAVPSGEEDRELGPRGGPGGADRRSGW